MISVLDEIEMTFGTHSDELTSSISLAIETHLSGIADNILVTLYEYIIIYNVCYTQILRMLSHLYIIFGFIHKDCTSINPYEMR